MGLRPTHGDEIASMVFVRSKGRDVLVLLFILNKSVILTVVKRSGGTCWGVRALGRKHFQERSVELQIPPLRYASVGMTLLLGTNKASLVSTYAVLGTEPLKP